MKECTFVPKIDDMLIKILFNSFYKKLGANKLTHKKKIKLNLLIVLNNYIKILNKKKILFIESSYF